MKHMDHIQPNSSFSFCVEPDMQPIRLDVYIASKFPLYSRSFFQNLVLAGNVTHNGKRAAKSGIWLKADDVITISFPKERTVEITDFSAKQREAYPVFSHEQFLIMYKPAGLLMHPPKHTNTAATLMDWLTIHYNEIKDVGPIDRPGIVHRLDRDTSGILIIPRTNHAHGIFGDMFRDRTIKKTYLAIVHGHPARTGTIDTPIGRDPIKKIKMATFKHDQTDHKARTATTNYTVLEYYKEHTLIEVKPITGRTHQIRVHFASIGHPLLGDPVYGTNSKLIDRHALHAYSLEFTFQNTPFVFTNEPPQDFLSAKKLLQSTQPIFE